VLASLDRWGDYPTWLAAIGTILAVVVAPGLAGRESRQKRHEDERRQAELITAWRETVEDMTTGGPVMPVVDALPAIAIATARQIAWNSTYGDLSPLHPARSATQRREGAGVRALLAHKLCTFRDEDGALW
jgi:hypothetical protein